MVNNIYEEIERQSREVSPNNFICDRCKHYKGGCVCENLVFIAFVGANMRTCSLFERGGKCLHCGRVS